MFSPGIHHLRKKRSTKCKKWSSSMDKSSEGSLKYLRRRLDQMGYKQHLGLDSVPLVSKVLSDLVHTTVSLRNAKLSAGKKTHSHVQLETWSDTSRAAVSTRLDCGDHVHAGVARRDKTTQTDEDLPRPPPSLDGGDQAVLADSRTVAQQEDVDKVPSELEEPSQHVRLLNSRVEELQVSKQRLEQEVQRLTSKHQDVSRQLARKDAILCQMELAKQQVENMAWMKLSASKEVILRQQEVMKDLHDNLTLLREEKMFAEEGVREQVEGEDDTPFLEEERSGVQDKIVTGKNLVLELEAMRSQDGDCGSPSVDDAMKSEDEARDQDQQTTECSRSFTSSPLQGKKAKFVLAATFNCDQK
ncbi:centrosomal protein of 135 kDa-like isoform X2 [Nerophis ophidion]|uniref:centrosomal protein of 135 kDa-like isoform X2 n=1 Tax=Nerophis ophidion TaxID=159077 RepID=UPI002ADFAF95|nr:centrosomal protein of 135 kDa-like isoform X2 [Nerophis ophidion]